MSAPNPSPSPAPGTSADSSSDNLSGLTRAELYERIRASSKEAVVLAEMQRLGYWPTHDVLPTIEASLIERETELKKALQELGRELHQIHDPVAALKAMRRERMAKARAKREETRQRAARERFERARAWQQRREHAVAYLGAGVSAGLGQVHSDGDKLARSSLPALHDATELAKAMGITPAELRFLAFERRVSRISHYRRFAMLKKTGGERIISAPMPRLKRAQYWVLDRVLARAPLHPAAHGFVAGRSIVSNAAPHVGQAVVINLDLKDFFPSIGMPRIKGVFGQLGYSEQIATILALLCTEAPTDEVNVDGETFFVAHGTRALPQGAPTSPMLTNILCRRLDARLQACAAKLGFRYTRYADDLTFSGDETARKLAGKLLWRAKQIVIDEGFTPHPDKQHVMRSAQRQMVTGIVVNRQLSLERDTLRRFRATLYQVERDGPAGKQWNGNAHVIDALEGYAQFIKMVDAAKAMPLLQRVRAARLKWGGSAAPPPVDNAQRRVAFRALSAQGQAPWTGWWTPAALIAPVQEKTVEQVKLEKREVKQAAKEEVIAQPALAAPQAIEPKAVAQPTPVEPETSPQDAAAFRRDLQKKSVPWGALLVQFALAFVFLGRHAGVIPVFLMTVLIVQSALFRKPRWKLYSIVMGAWLLGVVLLGLFR